MNATNSLSDWLAYIEQQHPSAIAMGLERVREIAARLQITAPSNARHRRGWDQWQGLHGGLH